MADTYRIMTLFFDKDKEPIHVYVPSDSFDAIKDQDLHVLRVEFSQEFPVPESTYFDKWDPRAVKAPEMEQ